MSQNTSSAVMQRRREPADSLDDFATPPWATRALIAHVLPKLDITVTGRVIAEPCCNRGHMAAPLVEAGAVVVPSDIHDYGYSRMMDMRDFLIEGVPAGTSDLVTGFVFNPPFKLAEEFIAKAMDYRPDFVAAFVRSAFLEGIGRWERLYSQNPPSLVAQFSERVILSKGAPRDPSRTYICPETGAEKKPSTATSYSWLVWVPGKGRLPNMWIPPCRRDLEQYGDYRKVF